MRKHILLIRSCLVALCGAAALRDHDDERHTNRHNRQPHLKGLLSFQRRPGTGVRDLRGPHHRNRPRVDGQARQRPHHAGVREVTNFSTYLPSKIGLEIHGVSHLPLAQGGSPHTCEE